MPVARTHVCVTHARTHTFIHRQANARMGTSRHIHARALTTRYVKPRAHIHVNGKRQTAGDAIDLTPITLSRDRNDGSPPATVIG